MSLFRRVPPGLRPLPAARLRRIRREVAEEIDFHLAMRTDGHVAEGMPPGQARAEAVRRFGDVDEIAQACTRNQTGSGLRLTLCAAGAFTTLTLGLSVLATVLLIVNAVLFRAPAGLEGNARRVAVWWLDPETERRFSGSTAAEIDTVRSLGDVFEHVSLARYRKAHLRIDGRPSSYQRVKSVSPEYFSLVGARPRLGRGFTATDLAGSAAVAVLGHDLWRDGFGADPEVLGRRLEVDGITHTIVGVMPRAVTTYLESVLYLPLTHPGDTPGGRDTLVAAALRAGVSRETAETRFAMAVAPEVGSRPADAGALEVQLRPLEEVYREGVQPRLAFEVRLALLVLVALLVHGLCRRIVKPPVAPSARVGSSVTLAVAAGGLAVLVAWGAASLFADPILGRLHHLFDLRPDPRTVSVIVGLGALGGLVTCVGIDLRTRRSGRRRTACALIAIELAVAMVLLLALVPPLGDLWRSSSLPPGFDPRGLAIVDIAPTAACGTARADALDRIVERARRAPGVDAASLTQAFPTRGRGARTSIHAPLQGRQVQAEVTIVEPGYTAVMKIPLLAGRRLDRADADAPTNAVTINRTLAERIAPGGDAVGLHLRLADRPQLRQVVGVVADVADSATPRGAVPELYVPYGCCVGAGEVTLILRTDGDPVEVGSAVATALRATQPAPTVAEPISASRVLRESRRALGFRLLWLALPAGLAILFVMIDLGRLVVDLDRGGLRDLAGPGALGGAIAATASWGLWQAGWPAADSRLPIDAPTAIALAVTLMVTLAGWATAVSWFTRRYAPPDPC